MKPTRSLKARALQLLSQREQSRVELRRKLLSHLKAEGGIGADADADSDSARPPAQQAHSADEPTDPVGRVEAVLDWLVTQGFASDERFAESRINARSARFGNLRIRQELKQHAVVLTPEAKHYLDESEEARAASVYHRRYPQPAESALERAKRARFLGARGFSPEVVRRVLRLESGGKGALHSSD